MVMLSYKRKKQAIMLLLFSVITSGFEVLTVGIDIQFIIYNYKTKIN